LAGKVVTRSAADVEPGDHRAPEATCRGVQVACVRQHELDLRVHRGLVLCVGDQRETSDRDVHNVAQLADLTRPHRAAVQTVPRLADLKDQQLYRLDRGGSSTQPGVSLQHRCVKKRSGLDMLEGAGPVFDGVAAARTGETGRHPTGVNFGAPPRSMGPTLTEPRPGFGHAGRHPASGHFELQLREIASSFAGQDLDREAGMPPRPVLPRQFYLITRRCTQRQLLLRPR
jgi:hypothetical protein